MVCACSLSWRGGPVYKKVPGSGVWGGNLHILAEEEAERGPKMWPGTKSQALPVMIFLKILCAYDRCGMEDSYLGEGKQERVRG